jgi:2-dehydropantoate 2-reductase
MARFVVVGAGAVGGVIGARLFEHGHDVVLVARGAHHDAIRDRGLRLVSHDGDTTLPIPVVDHPNRISFTDDDVVVVAVKSQDTLTVMDALAASASPGVAVACAQNGVENERVAARFFTGVYGVVVLLPTGHLEPGVVDAYASPVTGVLDVGRFPTGVDERATAIADAFDSSTFSARPITDVMRWKYSKLLINLGNAADALAGGDARGSELVQRARAEAVACLDAAGIAFASDEEQQARRVDLHFGPLPGRPRSGSSTFQSLERGTGTVETDYLNGEIVLLGRQLGIPTPVNALLQRLVGQAARERRRPGSYTLDELLARVDERLSEGVDA